MRSIGDRETLDQPTPGLREAMDSCLACKSCSGGDCPVRIDIPQMRAAFYNWYYTERPRPAADLFVRNLEWMLPCLARVAPVVNGLQSPPVTRIAAEKFLGLADLPRLAGRKFERELRRIGADVLPAPAILALTAKERENLLAIVQDGFTSFHDPEAALAQVSLVKRLHPKAVALSYRAGGKPLVSNGHLTRFRTLAEKNASELSALSSGGVQLLGLDPATTLMYRDEYADANAGYGPYYVQLISEWLTTIDLPAGHGGRRYHLIQHCTEKSLHPETTDQWRRVFQRTGLDLEIVDAGFCGGAGLFGHETRNLEMSRTLYDQTWRDAVEGTETGRCWIIWRKYRLTGLPSRQRAAETTSPPPPRTQVPPVCHGRQFRDLTGHERSAADVELGHPEKRGGRNAVAEFPIRIPRFNGLLCLVKDSSASRRNNLAVSLLSPEALRQCRWRARRRLQVQDSLGRSCFRRSRQPV